MNIKLINQITKEMKKSTLFAIMVILACIITGYAIEKPVKRLEYEAQKWERFLNMSANEGDAGTDSCYFVVFNKHINPYK